MATSLQRAGKLRLHGAGWGWFLALTSALAFSLVTPIGKAVISDGAPALLVLSIRFWTGTLLLALTLALLAPTKLRIDRRGFGIAVGAGLINGFGAACFFLSLTRIDASLAVMLFALSPLTVLGALALRGEKLSRRNLVRLGLGLAGVYFLIGPGGQTDWIGVLLVLIAIVGYTIELVAIQWYLSAYDIRTVTLYVLGGMATAITLAWLALGADRDGFGAPALAASLLLGALCTYFGWWAMFTAIRQLGTAQVALLSPFEVLLSIIWSFLWLGERFTSFQLVGAGLILVSASLAMQRRRRPAPDPSP
ncbi:MAG: DMT family transporter [Caldilineales bacterium]|nr:DMT family transporter [Caldilineales bacterium]MCW5859664.1 DMT family transporter [Caldilineales bacterium]